MVLSNKQKLLSKKWFSAQPAIAEYRHSCLENITEQEAALLWEYVTKLDRQKNRVFECEKRKQDFFNSANNKKFELSGLKEFAEITRKYKEALQDLQLTLAKVAASNFVIEVKNVLALEYINHEEEKTLRGIAFKTLPEDVLTDWVCFRMSGDSAECLNAFAEREHISLSLAEIVTSQTRKAVDTSSIMATAYVSFMYTAAIKEPSNVAKIGILMLLLETCEENYMISLKEASNLLTLLVEEYKEDNNLLDVPDDWVYDLLKEMV